MRAALRRFRWERWLLADNVDGGGPRFESGSCTDLASTAKLSRRQALGLIAVTAGGGTLHVRLRLRPKRRPAGLGVALLMPDAGVCAIMPETTGGPVLLRSGARAQRHHRGPRRRAAHRFGCRSSTGSAEPLAGKRVDIWHCDARGLYSGYPRQGDSRDVDTSGQKFLRGVAAHRRAASGNRRLRARSIRACYGDVADAQPYQGCCLHDHALPC